MIPQCPSTANNNFIPPDLEIINQDIYYLNKKAIEIYDTNNLFYGTTNGYAAIAHTCGSRGSVCLNERLWIYGTVKYIYQNKYILSEIILK